MTSILIALFGDATVAVVKGTGFVVVVKIGFVDAVIFCDLVFVFVVI